MGKKNILRSGFFNADRVTLLTVTAVFLFYTFGPNGNGQPQYSWVIWAIGGVLYAALLTALRLFRKR